MSARWQSADLHQGLLSGGQRPIGDIGCLELGAPELPVADEPRRATGWIACTSVQGHLKRAVELGVQLL